jgi:hypothetical protein
MPPRQPLVEIQFFEFMLADQLQHEIQFRPFELFCLPAHVFLSEINFAFPPNATILHSSREVLCQKQFAFPPNPVLIMLAHRLLCCVPPNQTILHASAPVALFSNSNVLHPGEPNKKEFAFPPNSTVISVNQLLCEVNSPPNCS